MDFSNKRLFVEEAAIQRNQALALTGTDDESVEKPGPAGAMKKGKIFGIGYDKLVVAVGCYSQTFGTKGVKENALFLKDIGDARKIRKRILDCKFVKCEAWCLSADSVQALKRPRFLRLRIR